MKCKWCNVSFGTLLDEDPVDIKVTALGKDNRGNNINNQDHIILCQDCYEHLRRMIVRPILERKYGNKN